MTAALKPLNPVAALAATATGVVDIGSNSVRLVVFEGARRSPLPLFNEKRICELGRGVVRTGLLDEDAILDTLALLRRFRMLAAQMSVQSLYAVATAAVREARNGGEFIARAQEALGHPIEILSGVAEAKLSALGVVSGLPNADGLVGDLGGGSLELIDVADGIAGQAETSPIGTLQLLDRFERVRDAVAPVDAALAELRLPPALTDRTFYAVGGTWRALARIHLDRTRYPLHIIDHLNITAVDALETAHLIRGLSPASLKSIPNVSNARMKTIPFGALVLERLIANGRPRNIVFSARGLREGLVYSKLPPELAAEDPLFASATDLSRIRARSLDHCRELCAWTDALFEPPGPDETAAERRLRRAACLLADIGWRAHPDYRALRCIDIIAQGNLTGIDHADRAFLALAVYFRHEQRLKDPPADALARLLDDRAIERARILGAAARLAFSLSAAMPRIVPRCALRYDGDELVLWMPDELASLNGPTVDRRLRDLASVLERSGRIDIAD